jgi:hypothetical protein
MGSGIDSVPLDRQLRAIDELLRAVVPNGFAIATWTVPLSQVESVWAADTGLPRTVFTIGNETVWRA